MRLTAQAITDAPIIINPLGEAVLQLRGLKIPYIENLGVSKDMYSVIDLVDNLIIEVKNIPKLKNLKCLLLARNNIVSVTQKTLGENLPNLNSITLTNNNLRNFRSIRGLFSCPALQEISLVDNDVTQQQNYRLILVWLIPTLKVLDFAKVKDRERKSAAEKYGTKQDPTEQGRKLISSILDGEDEEVEESIDLASFASKEDRDLRTVVQRLSNEERANLVKQLESADSLEEIERIESQLRGE